MLIFFNRPSDFQPFGELTIASIGKDPQSEKLVTNEYRVEEPVMIFVTTTNVDIDEELQNRCIVLTVNESREQTRAIQQLQRERRTLEEQLKKAKRIQSSTEFKASKYSFPPKKYMQEYNFF
ncbi:MAG: hypothetical protein HQM08_30890 [Candidatus Riflebacteria bacterium]|nr:hypothetical protein [Candidatus Riflebacteria bacterium]